MAEQQKPVRASLQDVINYEPDAYLTPEEIVFIQNTFKDPKSIRVLRKIFLPSVGDPALPIEQFMSDAWLMGRDYSQIQDSEIKPIVLARQDTIKFVMNGLITLRNVAFTKPENTVEETYRRSKDSAK